MIRNARFSRLHSCRKARFVCQAYRGSATVVLNRGSRPQVEMVPQSENESQHTIVRNHLMQQGFEANAVLGEGACGVVFKCNDLRTGQTVAVKCVRITDFGIDPQRELDALSELNRHPNIVSMLDFWESGQYIYIVKDLADYSLHEYISKFGPLDEDTVRDFSYQLITAVLHCHKHGVAHLDIKPENILIKDNTLQLTDFGLSIEVEDGDTFRGMRGSPRYAAPEIIKGDWFVPQLADVYSVGATIHHMLQGQPPIGYDVSEQDAFAMGPTFEYVPPSTASPNLKQFLATMLESDPISRRYFDFQHAWFREGRGQGVVNNFLVISQVGTDSWLNMDQAQNVSSFLQAGMVKAIRKLQFARS